MYLWFKYVKFFNFLKSFYILSNDNKVPEQVHSNQIQDLH